MHTEKEESVLIEAIKGLEEYTSRCLIKKSRVDLLKEVISRNALEVKQFTTNYSEIIIKGSLEYIEELKEEMASILNAS